MRFAPPSHDDDAPETVRQPHDWECTPWQAPYGVQWVCRACGMRVAQSLVVLSDPARVHSTWAALSVSHCPRTSAGGAQLR